MRDLVRLNPYHPTDPTPSDPEGVGTPPPAAPEPDPARPEPGRPSIRDGSPRVRRVAPFGLPSPEQLAAAVRLVDEIGLHLVCPEPRCRRAKRCRDPDPKQLPLCLWLHRGTVRFVLACLEGRMKAGDLPEDTASRPDRPKDTLLGGLRRAGWPIEQLARSREDGADEWTWEEHPEMRALVDEFKRPATKRRSRR